MAVAAAGWLLLFFVLLALPPASQPSRDKDATPGTEPLAPYERRLMAHVARRAGVRGEVPAPARRVNLHNREVAIDQVEPPAVAPPLANPGVPFDPRAIY